MGPPTKSYRSTSPSHAPLPTQVHSPPASPSSWSPVLHTSARQNTVLRAFTLVALVATFLYLTAIPVEELRRDATGTTYETTGRFFRRTQRVTNEGSFTAFLDSHFPLDSRDSPPPHIWITLADGAFIPGAANLDVFARQLNDERRAKYGQRTRETVVVTLCLDEGCIEACKDRGMYCYGGFEQRRPEMILKATWPKLASLIETVPLRDIFFVDADVSPRLDPYPHLETLMQKYDILAEENRAFEHLNSGFMWMRRSQVTADAWAEVLRMDLQSESRDQYRFNEVLGTTGFRNVPDFRHPKGHPLPDDFTAKNGLKVHVLDQRLFSLVHLVENDPVYESHDALNLHTTCADDMSTKLYLAKAAGFWNDVDQYYSRPSRLISVEHLSATDAQITQLFKVVLAAAYYTGRGVVPPEFATVTDLPNSPFVARRASSTFPLPHLERAFGVKLLEPRFVQHAQAHLLGRSVLNGQEARHDEKWQTLPPREKSRRLDTALALARVSNIDLRRHVTFASLVRRLRQIDLVQSSHIRFVNADRDENPAWLSWDFSTLPVARLRTCEFLEDPWRCDEFCRGATELKNGPVDGTWTSLRDLDF